MAATERPCRATENVIKSHAAAPMLAVHDDRPPPMHDADWTRCTRHVGGAICGAACCFMGAASNHVPSASLKDLPFACLAQLHHNVLQPLLVQVSATHAASACRRSPQHTPAQMRPACSTPSVWQNPSRMASLSTLPQAELTRIRADQHQWQTQVGHLRHFVFTTSTLTFQNASMACGPCRR